MLVGLAACASHPKPAPTVAPPPPPPPPARPAPRPAPAPPPVTSSILPGTSKDFVVNVGDRVYFDYEKYTVRPDAEGVLAAQAAWLLRYPAVQVRIEGNCDERGTQEYNLALGARRANSVKTFLVAHGVPTTRITTVSYGKEHPVDPGTGEQAWQHNRNAHTDIVSGAR
ncbi:MAG TPA: peptidoglycan-associated lipoprotein Pal [Phenylobacterium sp.]|nr:peptidoglycan-associated lipoprotein Pal [Phenylobacterium sp.]HEX3366262.1 peptidoglycan-associated lipoprotein Pal [Phenylobacterium sp.]